MFSRLLARILQRILNHWPRLYRNGLLQRFYWNLVAKDIDSLWGKSEGDWAVVAGVIAGTSAMHILDVGCGSGRLFPLYDRLGVQEVVGQDISPSASRLAANRVCGKNIRLTQSPIPQLPYAAGYFDLAISNRVLQHVPPDQIGCVVGVLCKLAKYVYINEMSDTDALSPGRAVIHNHDYEPLFKDHGFAIVDSGMLGKQQWRLFARSDSVSGYSPKQQIAP